MLFANVSPEDNERIAEAMKQTKDIRWYQRLHIIRLSSQGKSVPELTDLFGRCAATVRNYITRYNHEGFDGLNRQSSPGAPPQIPFSKADWEEVLHQSPSQFAPLATAARNWNQEFLVAYLRCYHGVTVTRQAVAASLKRHGVRLNRGRLRVTSPDPVYTVNRDRIDALKKSRPGHPEQP